MARAPIICEIIPKPNSAPQKLVRLGAAIEKWHDALTADPASSGITFHLDDSDIQNLSKGELPLPADLRASPLKLLGGNPPDWATIKHIAREHGTRRTVQLIGTPGNRYDRDQLVKMLHSFIADDLVADILIDGVSWNFGD
jgi:hypothetical protein